MSWETRAIPDIEHLRTKTLFITQGGTGYSGGSIFTEASAMEPDLRKAASMETAVLYETQDDWKTRRLVFQDSGEIVDFYSVGSGTLVAQNTRNGGDSLHESAHFLHLQTGGWKEVSRLEQRASRVWSSGSPWLLSAGFPEYSFDPVLIYQSSDGGLTWRETDLAGYNPLAEGRDPALYLNPNGMLYRAGKTALDRFDLNLPDGSGKWEKLRTIPINFKALGLSGQAEEVIAFGSMPDKKFGLTRLSGNAKVKECRGLPSDFLFTKLSITGDLYHLIGAVEVKNGEETIGFDNLIFESKDSGASWVDLKLPIKRSLNAYAFGLDGRIWATAAGNRMQVLLPRQ